MEINNTFSQTSPNLSRAIYQIFGEGGIINKHEYVQSVADFKESSMYRELVTNHSHYEALYWQLGYVLAHDSEGEFFHIKSKIKDEEDDEFNEAALKIMTVLTLFARIATQRGQPIDLLGEPVQGLTAADIDTLDTDEELQLVIRALKFKDKASVISMLKRCGFIFQVSATKYVLSKGALSMIDAIIEHQRNMSDDKAGTPFDVPNSQ